MKNLLLLTAIQSLILGASFSAQALSVQCTPRGHSTNGASVASMTGMLKLSKLADGQNLAEGEVQALLVKGGRHNIPLGKLKLAGTYSRLSTPVSMDAFHLLAPEQTKISAIQVNIANSLESFFVYDGELFLTNCQVRN